MLEHPIDGFRWFSPKSQIRLRLGCDDLAIRIFETLDHGTSCPRIFSRSPGRSAGGLSPNTNSLGGLVSHSLRAPLAVVSGRFEGIQGTEAPACKERPSAYTRNAGATFPRPYTVAAAGAAPASALPLAP